MAKRPLRTCWSRTIRHHTDAIGTTNLDSTTPATGMDTCRTSSIAIGTRDSPNQRIGACRNMRQAAARQCRMQRADQVLAWGDGRKGSGVCMRLSMWACSL